MVNIKKIEKFSIIGISLLVLGLFLFLMPIHSVFADSTDCKGLPASGNVSLRSSDVGKNTSDFDKGDCEKVKLNKGQYLWNLVLNPVGTNATATINGIVGKKNGEDISWTFITGSDSADNWVAVVSNGLKYSGINCNLQTALRVETTCSGGSGGTVTTETTSAETTEAETTEPKTTEAETTEPKTTEAETTEPKTTEAETTEPKTTEAETTEPKTTEAETTEPKTTEAETTEPKTTEAETTEPKTTEAETTEPKTTEAETTEPKTTEAETTEPKTTEAETTEPKTTEAETTEPKTTEAETTSATTTAATTATDTTAAGTTAATTQSTLPETTVEILPGTSDIRIAEGTPAASVIKVLGIKRLAYTGYNFTYFIIGAIALLIGIAMISLKRFYIK